MAEGNNPIDVRTSPWMPLLTSRTSRRTPRALQNPMSGMHVTCSTACSYRTPCMRRPCQEPALWHIVYADSEEEDLEESQVVDGLLAHDLKMQVYTRPIPFSAPPSGSTMALRPCRLKRSWMTLKSSRSIRIIALTLKVSLRYAIIAARMRRLNRWRPCTR